MDWLLTSKVKLNVKQHWALQQQRLSDWMQQALGPLPVQPGFWLPAGATVWGWESNLSAGRNSFSFSRRTFFFFALASRRIWAGSLAAFKGAQRKRHWGDDTQCFPYLHANKNPPKNCRNIWMNGTEPSALRSEMCGALHFPLYKPPVAFEGPNPRRNVYRSVLKTTPLTLKTAAIGSGHCQKRESTHKPTILVFFLSFFFSRLPSSNMSSLWKISVKRPETVYEHFSVCTQKEKTIHCWQLTLL